jgi:radical SAM superfamily enzyme YgiQ (UPF0313 family)
MEEAKSIVTPETQEIEWVDDDIFAGDEEWLLEFIKEWKDFCGYIVDPYGDDQRRIIPMYISTTSHMVLKASDKLLRAFQPYVSAVGMGIQAARPESLKLFNRQWDNEEKMKAAYDRLVSFGYRVNLQFIVGLPVKDPVEDAIETLLAAKRIGPGSICSCYPLMVYPGTEMEKYCQEHNFEINSECNGDTNSGICNINFDNVTSREAIRSSIMKRLRNICKLSTFFVKYNIDEPLIRALIEVGLNDETSAKLSMLRYRECVIDRLGAKGERIFNDILNTMKLRF